MTVYIEYVLIDNFVIDYLMLKATFSLTGKAVKRRGLFLSSLLGAVFALVYPIISVNAIFITLIKVLFGLLMLAVCRKWESGKTFYIHSLIFFAYTFLTGGAIIGTFNLLGINYSTEYSVALMVIPVYLLLSGISQVVKYVYVRKDTVQFLYDVIVTFGTNRIKAKGFLDTGNAIYFKGEPVVVCSKSLFSSLYKGVRAKECNDRITLSTVNGECEYPLFSLTELVIYIKGQAHIFKNVRMCVAGGCSAEYEIILHPALLGGMDNGKSSCVA